MIRSSIALSIITEKDFRMHSIRKNRPNPGINNQLRSVFSAFTDKGPKVGETEVYFYPKYLYPTEVKASTAASCTLMMQCMVPVLTALNA
jgi:RNA 3'-terminal phosphate cyclase (ATP)